jgi:hypothetical protein
MPQEVKVEKPTSSAGALNPRLKGRGTSRLLFGRARRLVAVGCHGGLDQTNMDYNTATGRRLA